MKLTKLILCFYFILIISTLLFIQCDIDHGLKVEDPTENVQHGIQGRIVFSGGWPENVAEARLGALKSFPTGSEEESLESIVTFSDPIQFGTDTLDYGLTLEPGTYQIIGVIFRERRKSWDITNIIAVHAPINECSIIPTPDNAVNIVSETTLVEEVDIFVDWTKGSISGKVLFSGNWSQEISFAGLITLEAPLNLLALKPCGIAVLPTNVDSANYTVLVPEGNYSLAIVAAENLADITDFSKISIIGFYIDPEDTSIPGVVAVDKNKNTPNININAIRSFISN